MIFALRATKVPELTKGKWIQRKTINNKALLGFFKIKVKIPDVKFVPPFPFRKNLMVCFPSGEFTTFVTLEELKAVNEPKYYTILDSWQYLDNNPTYPYKKFIENIYTKRMELKKRKDPLQLPLKIILNSIYGKTGEIVNGRIGNIFNPVIFSFIMSRASGQPSDKSVPRGTVFHTRYTGEKAVPFVDDGHVLLRVWCREQGGTLDQTIRYGLAVTIEAGETIPVYEEIRARLGIPVGVAAGA